MIIQTVSPLQTKGCYIINEINEDNSRGGSLFADPFSGLLHGKE